MEIRANIEMIEKVDRMTRFYLSTSDGSAAAELEKMLDDDLRVKIVRYRKPRSLNANAMLWACISDIANAVELDTWTIYIDLLRSYGKSTYICVKPSAVESVKKQWRESIELGPIEINGKPGVQMQVFVGSSTDNTEEMSRLIDGALQQMQDLDLPLPIPSDVQAALNEWETYNS